MIIDDQKEMEFPTISEASPLDNQTIDRRYHHIEYTCLHFNFASIADVLPMCLGYFEPWRTSPNVRRLFGDISPMVLSVETSGENFNACIGIFLDVPMPWLP